MKIEEKRMLELEKKLKKVFDILVSVVDVFNTEPDDITNLSDVSMDTAEDFDDMIAWCKQEIKMLEEKWNTAKRETRAANIYKPDTKAIKNLMN